MIAMVLKSVENRLERIFERTFSRPFKATLQPIEIGTRIVREVDLTRRLSSRAPSRRTSYECGSDRRTPARSTAFKRRW